MKKRNLVIVICCTLIIALVTFEAYSRCKRTKPAKEGPPFTIQQCDEWLKKGADSGWTNQSDMWTNRATACYLSYMVKRDK